MIPVAHIYIYIYIYINIYIRESYFLLKHNMNKSKKIYIKIAMSVLNHTLNMLLIAI
jgi:hypothetical protein